MGFAYIDEPQKIIEYLDFIFRSTKMQDEIIKIFGNYTSENLYALIH